MNISLHDGYISLDVDLNELDRVFSKCITSIAKSHPDFPYTKHYVAAERTVNFIVYSNRITLSLHSDPSGRTGWLSVRLFWDTIDQICDLHGMVDNKYRTPDKAKVFPNDLTDDKKLEFMKYVVKNIWDDYVDRDGK